MLTANGILTNPIAPQAGIAHALRQYQMARLRGRLGQWWAALTGRCRSLLQLDATTRENGVGARHYAGIQAVPIRQIRGTEERARDFDVEFNPLTDHTQGRWLSVFTALQRGAALPPVELTRLGETYFVRDGHHRISAARALGQEYIEAIVTVWQ